MSSSFRYRATIAYVGTRFHGWQAQQNAPHTVQSAVEEALSKVTRARVRVEGASRTDAGVHAEGQVAHFDLSRERETRQLRDGANARLTEDVRILAVDAAPPGFHARHDASWKEYLYRWSRAEVVPPRSAPFVAPISPRAEAEKMRRAAAALAGTRDFSVFGVRLPRGESGVRTLHFVEVREEGSELTALFRGDGFLRGMVRSIAGVLADVSRGRVPPGRIDELLSTGDRRGLCAKAPALGLTLVRVAYEDGRR
jgi:tRNA pseudouridine38-40 synthase